MINTIKSIKYDEESNKVKLKKNEKIKLFDDKINVELIEYVFENDDYKQYPTSFTCNFTAFNTSYNIVFKIYHKNAKNLTYNLQNYRSYLIKAEKKYKSNETDEKNDNIEHLSTAILSYNKEIFWNKESTSYRNNNQTSNSSLMDTFDFSLKLYKYHRLNITKSQRKIIKLLLKLESTPFKDHFIAFKFIDFKKFKFKNLQNIRQKRNLNSKYNLKIKVCFLYHNNIFNKLGKFFSTNNSDYIQMIFKMYSSYLVLYSNSIFRTINNQEFSINLDYSENFVFMNKIEELNAESYFKPNNKNDYGNNSIIYINKLINFFKAKKYLNISNCDHIAFFHDYKFNDDIGLAIPSSSSYPTSIIMFNSNIDMILALTHEIAHSLGIEHDTPSHTIKYLMSQKVYYTPSAFIFSQYSIDQFKKVLIKNGALNNKFMRLKLNNNNFQNNGFDNKISIGYFLSYSDQCKMNTLNQSSYAIRINKLGNKIKCSFKAKYLQLSDGSKCRYNRVYYQTECIDEIDFLKRSNFKFPFFRNKNLTSSFENLRNKCPQGPLDEKNLERKNKCEENLLNDHKTGRRYCLKSSYKTQCCEYCLQYEIVNLINLTKFKCESFRDQNPCFNNGQCLNLNSSRNLQGFYCNCKIPYKGPLCLNYDPCDFKPCKINETCVRIGELGAFNCILTKSLQNSKDLLINDFFSFIFFDHTTSTQTNFTTKISFTNKTTTQQEIKTKTVTTITPKSLTDITNVVENTYYTNNTILEK